MKLSAFNPSPTANQPRIGQQSQIGMCCAAEGTTLAAPTGDAGRVSGAAGRHRFALLAGVPAALVCSPAIATEMTSSATSARTLRRQAIHEHPQTA